MSNAPTNEPGKTLDEALDSLKRRAELEDFGRFLAEGSLYRSFELERNVTHDDDFQYQLWVPNSMRQVCLSSSCAENASTIFEACDAGIAISPPMSPAHPVIRTVVYKCKQCEFARLIFVRIRHERYPDRKGLQIAEVTKIGQWPALLREPPRSVVQGWARQDITFYREAITLRNAGKGIAALPYLRRIIEVHVADIMQIILANHRADPIPGFDENSFIECTSSHRFKDKLDAIKRFLPPGIVIAGLPNPIEKMYGLLSDGLHQRSEDECIEIFDTCRAAFEFVVCRLGDAKRNEDEYRKAIAKLNHGSLAS